MAETPRIAPLGGLCKSDRAGQINEEPGPVDCNELEVRIALTAFLRPFNILGWAALAIGDLQLVAPRDEVVLGAGLAWESSVTA